MSLKYFFIIIILLYHIDCQPQPIPSTYSFLNLSKEDNPNLNNTNKSEEITKETIINDIPTTYIDTEPIINNTTIIVDEKEKEEKNITNENYTDLIENKTQEKDLNE